MALLTTIAVTNAQPRGCTLTLSGAAVDLTETTIAQLKQVLDKISASCAVSPPAGADTPATVTLPAGF